MSFDYQGGEDEALLFAEGVCFLVAVFSVLAEDFGGGLVLRAKLCSGLTMWVAERRQFCSWVARQPLGM